MIAGEGQSVKADGSGDSEDGQKSPGLVESLKQKVKVLEAEIEGYKYQLLSLSKTTIRKIEDDPLQGAQ